MKNEGFLKIRAILGGCLCTLSAEGGYTKTEKPQLYAEASVMGWRRPTFPQINAVSSALRGLTSLFGMGRGGPPRYSHHVSLYMS